MRKRFLLAAWLLLFAPMERLIAAEDLSAMDSAAAPAELASYWLRGREGWFWYRDPPTPLRPAVPSRPRELVEFEAMQRQLEDLKRIAVMNPNDANLRAYMLYQQRIMRRSETFAQRWQRLVWTTPELDYGLSGRPTNTMAAGVYDEQLQRRQVRAIQGLAANHGLIFIFRGDCPYCHRFAPILKRFEEEYGIRVFPVSLDGQGLPEYPQPLSDNGIAARLNATVVPALYLTAPATREIRPVGFGLMASTELVERIVALATAPDEASF